MVLVLFMLLGAAWHNILGNYTWQLILAAVSLASTYACATCVNDLADLEIDKINLKGHTDRPLVTGDSKRSDLVIIAIAASVMSLSLGFIIHPLVGVLVGLILLMNVAYSLKPIRVSYRPIITPFYLVIGYIVLPYIIGVIIVGGSINMTDSLFLPALYFLFLSRICLKDFRDRVGDAKNNKPTFILKYGKTATCYLSLGAILVGSLLLLLSLYKTPVLAFELVLFIVALIATEIRLLRTNNKFIELISIGFGARIGNGMLFVLLGSLMLVRSSVGIEPQIILFISITALYAATFVDFWRNPMSFEFGNKVITDGVSAAR
jgi:chlorophyll synthase